MMPTTWEVRLSSSSFTSERSTVRTWSRVGHLEPAMMRPTVAWKEAKEKKALRAALARRQPARLRAKSVAEGEVWFSIDFCQWRAAEGDRRRWRRGCSGNGGGDTQAAGVAEEMRVVNNTC